MKRLSDHILTVRLWRWFWAEFPAHPLMWTVRATPVRSADMGCSPLLIGLLLMFGLPTLWVIGFGFALIAVGVGGTLRGIAAAAMTARAVYHERGTGRFDLLGLTPHGLMGAGWVLAQREFRRTTAGQFVNRYIQNAQRIIGIGVAIMTSLIIVSTVIFQLEGVVDAEGGVRPALEYALGVAQLVGVALVWLISDNAQSPLLGVLMGMWGGMAGRRKYEAGTMAAAFFTLAQLILFLAAVMLWQVAADLPEGLRLALPVALIIISREVMLHMAWRYACARLNAAGTEIPLALRL